MKFLKFVEPNHKLRKKGYSVFEMRLNEAELDTIAYLLDLHYYPRGYEPVSERGKDLKSRIKKLEAWGTRG